MVALISESSSSSPRMANCKCLGVIRFTFRSLEALPANSSTCTYDFTWGCVCFTGNCAQIHYLSCEVFQDSCAVHRCCSTDTTVAGGSGLQMSVDTSYGELEETHEIKIWSYQIKHTVDNSELNAIGYFKTCPTPPSCFNRKHNTRNLYSVQKRSFIWYVPADQLSEIWILLWL